ncbi:MAG TPA: hypothetical protein VJJ22_03065 [Candidatus Paceibacterota bacterium]
MKQRTSPIDMLVAVVLIIGVGTFFLWGLWIKETVAMFKVTDTRQVSNTARR